MSMRIFFDLALRVKSVRIWNGRIGDMKGEWEGKWIEAPALAKCYQFHSTPISKL